MRTKLRSKVTLLFMTLGMLIASAGVALASDVAVSVVDVTAPTGSVSLSPGASGNVDVNMSVTGNQVDDATFKIYRDWTLSGGSFSKTPATADGYLAPETFNVPAREARDAATTFSTTGKVRVASGQAAGGPFTLAIGAEDITNEATTGAKLAAGTSSNYQVTVLADPCASVLAPAAPVITANPNTEDGNSGWYKTIPTVSATSTTTTATITYATAVNGGAKSTFSSTAPTLGQGETIVYAKATSATCDKVSETSRTFKVDSIAPGVTPTSVNNTTWRNTSLSETFTASEGALGSGLALNQGLDANNAFTLTASAESVKNLDGTFTPTVVSKTVSDVAGNSTTRSVSALIDLGNPVISGSDIIQTAWRNTPLSANFTASDALSGLANALDASFTLTTSGDSLNASTPVTASKTVLDKAGNSDTRTISAFVDTVKPSLGITDNNLASYGVCDTARPVEPTTNPTDGLSGIPTGSLTTSWTNNLQPSGLGSYFYSASVSDRAGNTDSYGPKTYSVVAGSAYSGVLQPINLGTQRSSFKLGSTIPVKFTLSCGVGQPISNSVAKLYLSKTDATSDPVNEPISTNSPDIGNQFRVTDSATGQYQFNLSTKAGYQVPGPNGGTVSMSEGTWYLYIQLDGGAKFQAASFDIKK